jgi:hypothetical protein
MTSAAATIADFGYADEAEAMAMSGLEARQLHAASLLDPHDDGVKIPIGSQCGDGWMYPRVNVIAFMNQKPARQRRTTTRSYRPDVYFNHDWNPAGGHRFATLAEAEAFVAHLRSSWIPQGFIKEDRVEVAHEAPNACLNCETRQAERLSDFEIEPGRNDERVA